jgi:SynChlorMet cassette protein ScmD
MDATDRRPIADARLVLREEFDDWAILFDPDSGNGFGLNPISVMIWKLLDGKHNESDILARIHSSFDEVPDDAADHLKELIDELTKRGLVGYEVTPD